MAALTKPVDNITRYAEFSIDSVSELSKLPTTNTSGTDELSSISPVCAGSAAYTTDGNLDIYILNGSTNVWELS